MKRWTEGYVHIAMRNVLRNAGWKLIAGEYPGGSDHELYPLNIVDPSVARDRSPDPRRHSNGELVPDLIALKGRQLIVAEAKVAFSRTDLQKLSILLLDRKADLRLALSKFAAGRGFSDLLPLCTLTIHPTLVFVDSDVPHIPTPPFSFLLVSSRKEGRFIGELASFDKFL